MFCCFSPKVRGAHFITDNDNEGAHSHVVLTPQQQAAETMHSNTATSDDLDVTRATPVNTMSDEVSLRGPLVARIVNGRPIETSLEEIEKEFRSSFPCSTLERPWQNM